MYACVGWVLVVWSIRVLELDPLRDEYFSEWVYGTLVMHLLSFLISLFVLRTMRLEWVLLEERANLIILTPFSCFFYFVVRPGLNIFHENEKRSARRGWFGVVGTC